MFPERQKRLPYLCGYLQYLDQVKPAMEFDLGGTLVLAFAGLIAILPIVGGGPLWFYAVMLGSAAGLGYVAFRIRGPLRKRKPVDAEAQRLEKEARQVGQKLERLQARRRLHRDLSADVSAVLEEAARNWTQARASLDSPYWNRTDISDQLRSIRQQSLRAADWAMLELLVLFSPNVPQNAGSWSLAEVADEVLGKQVFAPKGNMRFSPFYEDGLRLAQRLGELARESEALSRRLITSPEVGERDRPGAILESTLVELRSMTRAEEELRQDLRS